MKLGRVVLATLSLATALVAAPAPGQDATPAYFAASFPGWVQRVAAGADGSVYAAGQTQIDDLPGTVVPPVSLDDARHVFVGAWTADGRLRWVTYLPFTGSYAEPTVRGIAECPDGSVWVACCVVGAGGWSDDDVGVAHVAADGSILVASQFGGTAVDRPAGLAVTADGDAIVAGTTKSPDFPATLASSWSGEGSTAFAARVRSDGTGVAWSRLLDVPGIVRGTAVCPDGAGGVLAAVAVAPAPNGNYDYDDLNGFATLSELGVVRISADGAVGETTALPHGDGGAILSLIACPDGSILASGTMAYFAHGTGYLYRSDAFVMRVGAETGTVTALWKDLSFSPARIAVEPSGDVLVGTDLRYSSPQYSYSYETNLSRVRRLTPDLLETATLLDHDGMRSLEDVAVATDGAILVVGHGLSVTFNPVAPETDVNASLVARIPPSGAAPATKARAGRTTRHTADLSWKGGDPVAGYEVERLSGSAQTWDMRYEVVAHLPAGAHSVLVSGLAPGESHYLRLVSVFASGVRSAARTVVVHTKPEKPSSLHATWTTRGIDLRWTPASVPSNVRLRLERRINEGPWGPLLGPDWYIQNLGYSSGHAVDESPAWGATSVAYRLRTVLAEGRGGSAWTYSNTVAFPQTFVGLERRPVRRSSDAAR
jgi:hypothetical protein